MHPTPRFVWLAALLVPWALVPLLTTDVGPYVWVAALALLLGAAGLDAVGAWVRGRSLRVEVRAPKETLLGDAATAEVRAEGARGTAVEVLLDLGPGLAPQPARTVVLAAGTTEPVAVPLLPRGRGRYAIERVWLRWTGPLGLMRRVRSRPVANEVLVVPNVRRVRQQALRFFGSRDSIAG